jgi:hypothetical protein
VCTQNTLVNNAVIRWGTEKQKEQWLPRLAQDTVGSFCLSYEAAFFYSVIVLGKRFGWGSPIYLRVDRSEWSCGSDAFALKATAKKDGDGYLLNGTKGTTKPTCWQPISPALISLVPLPSRQLGSPTPRRLVCSSSWPLWIPRPVHHHLTGFVFITVALIECGTHHCASIRLP